MNLPSASPVTPGCHALRAVLHPYLDGELAAAETATCTAHLAGCPVCSALIARHRRLSLELREALVCTPPATLRTRIVARARWHQRSRIVFAGAAAALLAIALLVAIPRHDDGLSTSEIHEVVDLHQHSLITSSMLATTATDPRSLSAWFSQRLAYQPWVGALGAGPTSTTAPTPTAEPDPLFTLLGARIEQCDHQAVATLVYRHHEHVITLISYPADDPRSDATASAPQTSTAAGLTLCSWVRGPLQYVAVSDMPEQHLKGFALLISEPGNRAVGD